jgi:hypothetical protein
MPKKKGKLEELKGSIKLLVGSLEVEEGSMVQGPSSSQPRDVQYRFLLDVLHFKLRFFGSLRSQIAVDNI